MWRSESSGMGYVERGAGDPSSVPAGVPVDYVDNEERVPPLLTRGV